jgi:ribonuclease BN (tRNA processing enzyme)
MRQLTVLGSCGAFPKPGRACTGFAVDWDGYRLVLDLGYATLPRPPANSLPSNPNYTTNNK